MATGGRVDPLVGYHFFVEIDGITNAQFKDCSGLESISDIVEYKETQSNGVVVIRKQPGALRWGDIVLRRGVTDVTELWEWRKLVEQGKMSDARRNGSIILFDQEGSEVARWNFVEGWPSKLSGPKLDSSVNGIAVEELVITHEGLIRES